MDSLSVYNVFGQLQPQPLSTSAPCIRRSISGHIWGNVIGGILTFCVQTIYCGDYFGGYNPTMGLPNILYALYCDCSSWVGDNTVSDTSPVVADMYVKQVVVLNKVNLGFSQTQSHYTGSNTGLPQGLFRLK
jgi:hypothetical protein